MQIKELKGYLPPKLFDALKVGELRPCQEKAIRAGLLEGRNLLVCSPTGSGKTLIAEIAALKAVEKGRGKAVYIVPLKALALEKYNQFKQKYPWARIAISIGDLDSNDPWLADYDLIITTCEKLDSLIRHGASWISQLAVIVIDEIHLLNDLERGPTLEILLTLLKSLVPNAQYIGLSATIGNTHELAGWLGATLIQDNWRPVKLYEGVLFGKEIDFFGEKEARQLEVKLADPVLAAAVDTLALGKQALIFCPSKKSAESVAERLAKILPKEEGPLKHTILNALPRPTSQCRKLAFCISARIAFHHAGLIQKQRELVEKGFRDGQIKIICCTPTLAAGIDVPAFRAIIRSLKRYSGYGASWLPILEYKQAAGRAGRPGFEDFGEAITIAKSEDEKELIYQKYITGQPEPINSKLAVEPILRAAVLALIASDFVRETESLLSFFEKTFFAYQYSNIKELERKILAILQKLKEYNFIEGEQLLHATRLGKRVSELYIDPESGHLILTGLQRAKGSCGLLPILHLICSTTEIPSLRARVRDSWVLEQLELHAGDLLTDIPSEWDWGWQDFLSDFKTALLFNDWAEEKSEDHIMEKYSVRPGELHSKLSAADWLLYAASELARTVSLKQIYPSIQKARMRVKYGVHEELLPLVKLPSIGRYRARKLYTAGFKNIKDLKSANIGQLSTLLGKQIALKIKNAIGAVG